MSIKTFIPMMHSQITKETREKYAQELKRLSATRFYICFDRNMLFLDDRSKELDLLRENTRYFEDLGYEVGIWIQAFGFGDPLSPQGIKKLGSFTHLRNTRGRDSGDAFCPEDEGYMEVYLEFVREIIDVVRPKMLQIDDDLCFSARNEIGCFCHNHMKLLCDALGEELSREELVRLILTGGKNKYRSTFLKVMGDSLRKFCRRVRETVDSVDKTVRVGFCAGYTSWDIEGVDALELTDILKGEAEPFLRLSGAPYWVAKDYRRFDSQRLNSVIEFTRLQEKWCRDKNIPCFSETDVYPRPRYYIPANIGECFSVACRAAGDMDDMKYPLDYYSPVGYEDGYTKHHLKNAELRQFIDKHFEGKKSFGVKVFETMHKFEDTVLPNELTDEFKITYKTAFSPASSLLTAHSIPTTYEDGDFECGIAFGENALYLKGLPKKMIIDLRAASILKDKGIDVGFSSFEKVSCAAFEFFGDTRALNFRNGGDYYNCALKDGAKVLSTFSTGHVSWQGAVSFPAAYTYKSDETEFLVLCYDAYTVDDAGGTTVSYGRGRELQDFVGKMPYISSQPAVYQIAKKNDTETALFFANIYEDSLIDFEINLGDTYSSFESIGVDGEIKGDKFIAKTDVAPYGMFAIVLRK